MAVKNAPGSILRATAILGSSSVITILLGLISSKAWAVLLGPKGVGTLGLMQGLLALLATIASLGIPTGLVRQGALALSKNDHVQFSALKSGAWLLFWVLSAISICMVLFFHGAIARIALGSPGETSSLMLVCTSLLFTLAYGIQNGILNAYHRVGTLAKIAIISTTIGTAVNLILAWQLREHAIGLSIVSASVISWCVSRYFLGREGSSATPITWEQTNSGARNLVRFGLPYTASALVGGGVVNLLPIFIFSRLGQESVGYYRASTLVAVNYLAFLLNAMAQDYYPRVSAVSDEPATLVALINQQFRLAMTIGVPAVLACLALSPYILPLIYTSKFAPAAEILEWQLLGDLFKLTSWTMSYVILARCSSLIFFCIEATGGAILAISTYLSIRYMGLPGIGFAFFITYLLYSLIVWFVVRRTIGFQWTQINIRILSTLLIVIILIRLLPAINLTRMSAPFTLIAAALSIGISTRSLLMKQHIAKSVPIQSDDT